MPASGNRCPKMGPNGAARTGTPANPFSHALNSGAAETRCLWLEVHYSSIEQGTLLATELPFNLGSHPGTRSRRAERLTCASDESCPTIPLSKESRLQCATPSLSERQIHSRKLLRWRIVDELCCMANFAPLAKTFAARAVDFRPSRRRTRLASCFFSSGWQGTRRHLFGSIAPGARRF